MSADAEPAPANITVHDPLRAIGLMMLSSLGYAVMGALVKRAGQDLSLMTVVLGRSLVAGVAAALLLRARGLSWRPGNTKLLAWRCILGFVALSCYFAALVLVPLASAVTLQFTSPLFVALFSARWLGESVSRTTVWCVIGALAGAVCVVSPDPSAFEPLALLALISSILAGLAYVMVRKLRETDSPEVIVLWFAIVSAIGSAPLVAIDGAALPDATGMLVLVGVGLSAFVAQLLMTYALRYGEAAWVSAFSYATVVFSAGLGLWLFAEVPGVGDLVGAALIIGSGVLNSTRGRTTTLTGSSAPG